MEKGISVPMSASATVAFLSRDYKKDVQTFYGAITIFSNFTCEKLTVH